MAQGLRVVVSCVQVGVASVVHRRANDEDKARLLHELRIARMKLAESGALRKPTETSKGTCLLSPLQSVNRGEPCPSSQTCPALLGHARPRFA